MKLWLRLFVGLLISDCGISYAGQQAWVSTHGTDAAQCGSLTSPCRTLQYAHDNAVGYGGEVSIMDPGSYGTIEITKSISIINRGGGAAIANDIAQQTNCCISIAINVNIPANEPLGHRDVYLRGLTIDQSFWGSYNIGLALNSAAFLSVQDCHIQNVTQGIVIRPSATKDVSTKFSISNTSVNKTQDAIFIAAGDSPTVGSPRLIGFPVWLSVTNSSFVNNSQVGIGFFQFGNDSAGQKVWVNLHNDQISGNAGNGIYFRQSNSGGGPMTKYLQVWLSDSLIVNNLTGIRWDNVGPVVFSGGGNVIRNLYDNYLGGTLDRFSKQ